jgi:hypothetical protein
VKFYDRAPATVYIASLDAVASEPPGGNTASFTVFRDEVLPNTTSVLLFVSGSATAVGQGVNFDYLFSAGLPNNFLDVPADRGSASVTITPRDDARVEGDESAVFTILPRLGIYDIVQPNTVTLVIRDNDVTAGPVVNSSAYVFDRGPPQRVRFSFNQDVAGSIGSNDFSVTGPSGPAPFDLTYDSITNTATLGLTGGLPNGNYTARAIAAGLTNGAGTPMAADSVLSFFVLGGDINRDRAVNGTDFAILAGNFGKTGTTFAQGDLNGDGSVNGSDFALLAGNFGKTVPAPQASSIAAIAAGAPSAQAAPARLVEPVPRKRSYPQRPAPVRRRPGPAPLAGRDVRRKV